MQCCILTYLGLTEGIFDSSGFQTEGDFISAAAVRHHLASMNHDNLARIRLLFYDSHQRMCQPRTFLAFTFNKHHFFNVLKTTTKQTG